MKTQTPQQIQETTQTIEHLIARIYLLEQYILLTEGSEAIEKLRKNLALAVPETVENIGISLNEMMDSWVPVSKE